MSTTGLASRQTEERRKEIQDRNRELGRRWSAFGWGLFLVLVGGLVLADSRGWLHGGEGWLYFMIGLGGIFIVGFLTNVFGNSSDRWGALGGLIAGVSLIYVGAAFLYGFGDWWPLALVFAGVSYIARESWSRVRHATREIDAT